MKRVSVIIICFIVTIVLFVVLTSTPRFRQTVKSWTSSVSGLNRHVTLYDNSGTVIKEWFTKTNVEYNGATCRFLSEGKAIVISGTIIIEEIE